MPNWCNNFIQIRHKDPAMIERVLKAPINIYFDTTPIGRIMNRFSKDL